MESLARTPDESSTGVEQAGVEFLPDAERRSTPFNMAMVFVGAGFTLNSAITGWIYIGIGLSFLEALTAAIAGLVIGTVVMVPTAVIGPRTGTNMTVASGAEFGIRGRLIGSLLALLGALGIAAITVWTSGDAIVASLARLVGFPDNDITHAVGYAIVAAGMVALAIYGHDKIVAAQKIVAPIGGIIMIVGFFALAPSFQANPSGGEYLLGSFWPTWIFAATIAFSVPLSYAPTVGDYTRRISNRRHSERRIAGALSIGMIGGALVPTVFGAFTATAIFGSGSFSYVGDLVAASPLWYLPGIIVLAIGGGIGQGVLCIYATGLDTEGLFPRLTRVQTTSGTAIIAVALLYIGVFVFNAVDSISALALLMNAMITPWVVVMVIGLFRRRRVGYDAHALQAFARHEKGGRYWYSGGWNVPAVIAWAAGALFGVLAVTATGYVGPLANLAGGIDISIIGSATITAVLYLLLAPLMHKPGTGV
nr:cytosine permease [uncultured Microbacterium sp.]